MDWVRRRLQPRLVAAARPRVSLSSVAEAVDAARLGGGPAVDRLIELLVVVDETGDRSFAGEALARVQAVPRVIVRLDERCRRVLWSSARQSPVPDRAARRSDGGRPGPIAVALASTHRDGHVRERAVGRMVERPEPVWMPFLVLRTADWVKPVRDRARAGLALLLADEPQTLLPAALGMALTGRSWYRGGFAYTQALATLLNVPAAVRDRLLATASTAERRFLVEIGLAHGWWPADVVFTLAVTDTDVWVRVRAAELLCRQAVWSERVDTLRRLARHPGPEVRQVALTGLLRLGDATEVAAYLDDRASLIRAIAREAARRADLHALQHYRQAVTDPEPATGAIAGLAETGGAADATLLVRLLVHPNSRVRAQAIRALRHLAAVPVEQTIPMLQDPSPKVIRQATAALTALTRALPADLAPSLLDDPHRAEVRRAGYRLLRARGPVDQLRAALLLATDPDPRLARRAVADATHLARDATDPSRRLRQPTIDPPPAHITELIDLTNLAATALGPDTTRRLNAWLTSPIPRA